MPSQFTYKPVPFSSQNWLKNTPVFNPGFSGKEKDAETGYHYFGARYYNSDLSLWLSVDPMSDKYPSLSPYNYCAWNPMKLVDPDGGEINPVYGSDGGFRGCTKEGFTGQIIIYDGNLKFDDLSEKELYQKDNNAMPLDIAYGGLSSESKSKIYTNVMSNFEGDDILGTTFYMSDVKDGKIYHKDGDCNFATTYDSEGKLGNNSIIYATDKFFQAYEATVENLASSLICHEWFSHKIQGCSDKDRNHQQAYINVKNGPYWGKTTESYKEFINKKINKYEGR